MATHCAGVTNVAPTRSKGAFAAYAFRRNVVAESNLSLSDMALRAARLLYDGASQLPRPDQIIVCSTSFEHDLTLSCAGRLHNEPHRVAPIRNRAASGRLVCNGARSHASHDGCGHRLQYRPDCRGRAGSPFLGTLAYTRSSRMEPLPLSSHAIRHLAARARPDDLYAGHAQQLQRHRNARRFRHAYGRHRQGAGTSCLSGHTNGLDCPSEDG